MKVSRSTFLLLSLSVFSLGLPSVTASGGDRGIDIVGVGPDPSSAVHDGIRQIREVFGKCSISSETVVENSVLKRDLICGKLEFSGSKLDRFHEGRFRRGDKYFAVFRFPPDFLRAVRSGGRDRGRSSLFASFDEIRYNFVSADSFGEEGSGGWQLKIPKCIRRFVDFFVWHVDEIGSLEIVMEEK